MRDPVSNPLPLNQFPKHWLLLMPQLRRQILNWYRHHGRHHLPWQNQNSYQVWVSEIMLQQTQVKTVLPKYEAWMKTFPTLEVLAKSDLQDVLKIWEGLGYYARARHLHQSAQKMIQQGLSELPRARKARLNLPGIGLSTASALGAFVFQQPESIFDGNVARIWERWSATSSPSDLSTRRYFFWSWSQHLLPKSNHLLPEWTQALMDLGALVCTPKNPSCERCPLKKTCQSYAQQKWSFFPIKKPSTQKKDLIWEGIWVENGKGQIGLLKNPNRGLWSGLWMFPEKKLLEKHIDLSSKRLLNSGIHLLTHRKVKWSVCENINALSLEESQSLCHKVPSFAWFDKQQVENLPFPQFLNNEKLKMLETKNV